MASSTFASSIDSLIRARENNFIERVAQDYNLNLEELRAKYTEPEIKVPKQVKKRKATVEVVDEEGQPIAKKGKGACQGITSKKEVCKFSALKGGCFCKRHQKAHEEAEAAKAAGIEVPVKKVKVPKEPKVKETEPMHTHAVDDEAHADCGLCQSHGAIFGGIFEAEEAPFEERIKMVIEHESDDESEDDEGDEAVPAPIMHRDGGFMQEEFSDAEFPADD
jgi:hypothetical protein